MRQKIGMTVFFAAGVFLTAAAISAASKDDDGVAILLMFACIVCFLAAFINFWKLKRKQGKGKEKQGRVKQGKEEKESVFAAKGKEFCPYCKAGLSDPELIFCEQCGRKIR